MMISHQEAEARRALYEEGGKAIGELLCRYPEKEPEIWRLVAGARLWTRKDLAAFKSLWRRDNELAYNVIKQARYARRKAARKRTGKLRSKQQEASAEAMPTERDPRKKQGNRE